MLIMAQDGEIFNSSQIISYQIESNPYTGVNAIIAKINKREFTLGLYSDVNRANRILDEICANPVRQIVRTSDDEWSEYEGLFEMPSDA